MQKEYLEFLRGIFKGAKYVELVYMTGILPIKKYGEHSALNIFEDILLVGVRYDRDTKKHQCVIEKWTKQ